MRVVGGIYKGRTLLEFKGKDIRPTSDMARESLFNVLQFKIQDRTFLDLFCGTGAVGIEALSRGAKHVTFNDLSRESVNLTKNNLEKIGNPKNAKVVNRDGVEFYLSTDQKFDYVFMDPPYDSGLGEQALENVCSLLSEDGVVIFESQTPYSGQANGLIVFDQRRYGRAYLTFFKKENK